MRAGPRLAVATALLSLAWAAPTRSLGGEASGGPSAGSCPSLAIEIAPGQPIQDAVDRAAEGAVFCLKAGVHRLQEVRPKSRQSFHGERGAVLNGARAITSFERDGPYWVATGQNQRYPRHGECLTQFPACNMPEALFIDDRPLQRVLRKSRVAEGRFYLDGDTGRLYLADDPRGRTVEATVARFAFDGPATDVLIRNLVVEKYSSPAQYGAINGRSGKNWTIEGAEARWNSGAGISMGSGGRLLGCNVHHNGQLGVRALGSGIVLEGNEIWQNNIYGFDDAWEAGGVKVTQSEDVKFLRNHVHRNAGSGLWCDINCRNVLYEGNVIEQNDGPGIFHEVSFDALIHANTLRHNGRGGYVWFWNADIQIAASQDVEVRQNDITVNAWGGAIMLIDQGRPPQSGWQKVYKTRNNYVHHNTITFEGAGFAGGASDTKPWSENYAIISQGQNRFDYNVYRSPQDASIVFAWGHARLPWAGFREQGQEHNGAVTAD
jgi:hypothetical protein